MNTMTARGGLLAVAFALATFSLGAHAQTHSQTHAQPPGAHPAPPNVAAHYDRSRYYPPRGRTYAHPPRDAYEIRYRSRPYYYHSGNWYHHDGSHFVIVAPPIGIVAPLLPPFYSTLWVGGYPYYYANDVYYAWRPAARGYVVVEPPPAAQATAVAPASELYVYPAAGQSAEQQATDRYECHTWAVGETGFDPVKPQGGVSAGDWSRKREDYQRALAACLTGRAYSVK